MGISRAVQTTRSHLLIPPCFPDIQLAFNAASIVYSYQTAFTSNLPSRITYRKKKRREFLQPVILTSNLQTAQIQLK